MSALLRLALDTLQDAAAAPGLRSVASSTLLAALDNAIEVPVGSHMACWRYLLGSDQSAAAMHRHELVHPEVARDAVRVLLDAEAGETAQDLAMATLRGANVSVVTDDDVVTIADRVLTEGRSRRVTWLIEQTHEYRGLDPAFLVLIRDRLAGADEPTVRSASIDIGALLPRLDVEFATKMFGDRSPLVRSAVADSLDKVEPLDRDRALRLIRNRLDHESNRIVLSACYASLSSLIRRRPRQGEEN
jgi:Arc/MetJ-type ribon-helix-helix transcriptional regulator